MQRRKGTTFRRYAALAGMVGALLSGCTPTLESRRTPAVSEASAVAPTAGRTPSHAAPRPEADIPRLRERLKSSPDDSRAHYELGVALIESAPADAARHLRAALKRDPQSDAYQPLAHLYETAGYTDRLIETLEARVQAEPNDGAAVGRLAILYLGLARRQDARRLMAQIPPQATEEDAALDARARFYYIADDFPKAIAAMETLVTRHPDDSFLRYRLSELQRAGGQYVEAEKSVRDAIQAKPDEGLYYRQLAHILATLPSPTRGAEAEQAARKAMEWGENSLDTRYWLAVALDLQRKPEAAGAFQNIADEDVTYEKTAYILARLYRKAGKKAEAERLLKLHDVMFKNQQAFGQAERELEAAPTPPHYRAMADFRLKLNDAGMAIATLRQGLKRFPDDAQIKNSLRAALNTAGRRTEANLIP